MGSDRLSLPRIPAIEGVRPRTLLIVMAAIVVVAVAVVWWMLAAADGPDDGIVFETFSAESTATAVFAGQFPRQDTEPLRRPLGIDGDGERLFVAEADAARISVRGYDGALIATIGVAPARDAAAFYPVDVAVLPDARLAVVDTGGTRVVVVDVGLEDGEDAAGLGRRTTGPDGAPLPAEEFSPEQPPGNPTAIAVAGDVVAIADASDGTVRLYDVTGEMRSVVGAGLEPPLTFVGDVVVSEDGATLTVADSNAGRVVEIDVESGELRAAVEQRFALPRGLAQVLGDRLAVVETFGRLVRVALRDADLDGLPTEPVGGPETERVEEGGTLTAPNGAFWDEENRRLYVTDPPEGMVKVYELREAVE